MLCCGPSKKARKLQKHKNSNSGSEPSTITVTDSGRGSLDRRTPTPTQFDGGIMRSQVLLTPLTHSKDNLFENTIILQAVLKNLTLNQLLRIRMVNKLWNKHACQLLREKIEGVVILQRGMEYYSKVMKPSLDVPIGRVFLNILNMNDPAPKNFFRSVGHSILTLILNLEGKSVPHFQGVLHHLQNMRQFSINLFNNRDKDDAPTRYRKKTTASEINIIIEDVEDSTSYKPIQLELPNLESVIMSCENNWTSSDLLLLQTILRGAPNVKNLNLSKWPFLLAPTLLEKVSIDNLQFLTVRNLTDKDLTILAKKKLHLKSAEFHLNFDVEVESFDKFIESISTTLEYLVVESKTDQNLKFQLHHKMSRLINIRLAHWVGPICLDSVVGKCDNLMKLQLSNCDPATITTKHLKPNPSVKKLAVSFGKFTSVSSKIRNELVKNFIFAFPHLEAFMMKQVSDKTVGLIVDGWPRLKTLRVTSTFGLTDSSLTGIPFTELSKMTKIENRLPCGCCLPVPVVNSKPKIDSLRQYPHIGKLKDLLDFSFESEDGSHFPLSNFSLHLGLEELTKLESLKLTCHKELGPHWCLKSIADNLPNLRELTVMDRAISHDRYEEQEMHYLLNRLPKMKLHLAPPNIERFS